MRREKLKYRRLDGIFSKFICEFKLKTRTIVGKSNRAMFDLSIQIQSSRRKCSFFSFLMSSMLWIESLPSFLQYILEWASHIQYVAILYWGMFELVLPSDETTFLSYIQSIAKTLAFQNAITPDTSDSTVLVLTAISYAYLSLFLLAMVLVFIKFRQRQQTSRSIGIFINFLTFFHFAVGFWIVNVILMNNFQTIEENGTGLADKALAINIINLISIFVNYLFGFISSFLSYDPLTTTNLLSAHTSAFQLLTFFFKAFIIPVVKIFSIQSFSAWYFVIVSLIISVIRHYYLLANFPFYHYKPTRLSISFSLISTLLSLFNLILLPVGQTITFSKIIIFYAQLMIFPLSLKTIGNFLRDSTLKFISLEDSTIKSESDVIKKLFALNYLIENIDVTSEWIKKLEHFELKLWGAVSNAYNKIHGFNTFSSKKSNDTCETSLTLKEQAQGLIKELLVQGINRIKSSNKIRIIFANRMSEDNKTLHIAIGCLSGVSNQQLLTRCISQNLYVKLEKKVENIYKSKEGVLDIKTVIDQTVILNKFVKMVHANSKKVVQFWENYKKTNLRILDLLKKSREIEQEDLNIKSYWTQNIGHRKIFACSLGTLYSVYLSLVRNAPYSAFKVMENHPPISYNKKNLSDEELPLNETNLFGSRNIVLTASMAREKLGKVLYASHNITELIGWTQHDIIGSNVNILIQPIYRELHNQILLKHLENRFDPRRKSRLYQNIQTFIVTKEGKSLPCCLYLAMHPYIQRELVYVGILRVKALNKYLTEKRKEPYKNRFTSSTLRNNFSLKSKLVPMSGPTLHRLPTTKAEYTPKKSLFTDEQRKLLETPKHAQESFSDPGPAFSIVDLHKEEEFEEDECEDDDSMQIPNERVQQDGPTPKSGVKFKEQVMVKPDSDDEIFKNEIIEEETRKETIKEEENEDEGSSKASSRPDIDSLSMRFSIPSPMQKRKFSTVAGLSHSPSSHVSSSKNSVSKIEQSVYILPRKPRVEALRYVIIIFLLITSGLLVFFHIENTRFLTLASQSIDMLSDSTFRLFRIVETARAAGVFPSVLYGMMSASRYSDIIPVPDARMVAAPLMASSNQDLSVYNNKIRTSLHKIDADLQTKFYDNKIPIIEIDPSGVLYKNRSANSFDFCTEIVAAVSRILTTPYSQLSFENPDFVLVSHNTRDELLTSSKEIISILRVDLEQKLHNETEIIISVSVVIAFISLFIAAFFFWLVRILIKNRNRIIEIFLRLDVKMIEMRINAINKFCTTIEKDHMNIKALNSKLNMSVFMGLPAKKEIVKSLGLSKRKRADSKGINISILTMNIYTILLMLLIFSAFLFVLGLVLAQNSAIIKKTNLMMESDLNLYDINLLFATLYPFVYMNMSSTVYNRPIKEVWEELFTQLTQAQNNFVKLIDENDGVGNIPELEQIITGNICDVITPAFNSPETYAYCLTTASGVLLKGVMGGTSLLLKIVQNVKESFESSPRGLYDMVLAVADPELVNLEIFGELYLFKAFERIDTLIKAQLNVDLEDFRIRFETAVMIFIVAYFLSGVILWWKVENQFKIERAGWRQMMRLIPHQMIMVDKLLKDYLVSHSEGVLDSLKQSIHLM